MKHSTTLAVFAALAAAPVAAQDARAVAFTNARLVLISGATIESGTLVVKNGKIEAIGADVTAPAGARIVDCAGLTILPGLVSAVSRAGLAPAGGPRPEVRPAGRRRGREETPAPTSGGDSAQNRAAAKVVESMNPRQEVFGDLLRAGVTTLALSPAGSGFPGLGAVLQPDGRTLEQLTVDDGAFVQIDMTRNAATKKLLKETFEKAQKLAADRKKPAAKPSEAAAAEAKPPAEPGKTEATPKPEPPKPEQPKPEPKPEPPKPEPPKPEPPKPEPKPDEKAAPAPAAAAATRRPEPQKDPNLEVIADLLDGKRRAIVSIGSAADLLQWQLAVADEIKFPHTIVVARHDPLSGTVDRVADALKTRQCTVLLPPDLSTLPRTRLLIHPARLLHDAGIEIGFVLGDNPATVRMLFFRLMELVRTGLPADAALRAVTLVPAKVLGVEAKKGSLEAGKDADLLVFRGDPLSPSAELVSVWLRGREVPKQP